MRQIDCMEKREFLSLGWNIPQIVVVVLGSFVLLTLILTQHSQGELHRPYIPTSTNKNLASVIDIARKIVICSKNYTQKSVRMMI